MSSAHSPFAACRVRVNVTHEGRLIALLEEGAVVELSVSLPLDRQTTLTVETDGETIHLRARVVRSFVRTGSLSGPEHYLALEFLDVFSAVGVYRRLLNGAGPARGAAASAVGAVSGGRTCRAAGRAHAG